MTDRTEYMKNRNKKMYAAMLKARLYPLAESIKQYMREEHTIEELVEFLYNENVRVKNK